MSLLVLGMGLAGTFAAKGELPVRVITSVPKDAASPSTDETMPVSPLGDVVTFEVHGPNLEETSEINPFTDVYFAIVLTQDHQTITVPGAFAADGDAAETSATGGTVWRAKVIPPSVGPWSWIASFRQGPNVRLDLDRAGGEPLPGDGATGTLSVTGHDGAEGVLRNRGGRYLTFDHSGRVFLKSGADSPENLLAYVDFDQTVSRKAAVPLHRYQPHANDARPGDPTWQGGRGRNLLGAIHYLADHGVNSLYILTMNRFGDGDDVWPWTSPDERWRFDVSKLEQWDRVFTHAQNRGVSLHLILTETENETLFEAEANREADKHAQVARSNLQSPSPSDAKPAVMADARKLYYLEMVSRFSYHKNLIWNIGEENGMTIKEATSDRDVGWPTTNEQRLAFAGYLRSIDPHGHPIVVHTAPGAYENVYRPLLGSESYDGASLQLGDMTKTHAETIKWVRQSAQAGRPWFVMLDEIGPANTGVKPDADDPGHDAVRQHALWGNLMGGGSGAEWYFGYKYPHDDLRLEDFRSREEMWRQSAAAVRFFHEHVPLATVQPADELVTGNGVWCLAEPGTFYLIYAPPGSTPGVRLPPGRYRVETFAAKTLDRDGETTELVTPQGERSVRLSDTPLKADRVLIVRRLSP